MARRNPWLAWIAALALIATTLISTGGIAQAAPIPAALPAAKVLKTGTPTISGTLAVGSTVTVKAGSWTSKTKFSYQWLRDGTSIKGATKSSYKLAAADAGKQLSVRVTGKLKGYQAATATSAATVKVVKPATPKVTGTVAVGSKLTAVPGRWSPGTQFSYQWLRSGKKIKGATSVTYRVGKSDIGKQLSVTVTGRQSGWAKASRTSAKSAKVLKAGTPTISGKVSVGSTVTVKAGSWTSKTKLTYQWLRDGTSIKGATKSSYKITSADAGKKLSVKVTGKLKGYATASKTSAAVTPKLLTLVSATPKITGDVYVGRKQTAQPGAWTSGTKLAYQWYADGTAIKGATSSTYTLTYREIGKRISVKVTGSKAGYAMVTKSSATRGPVPTIANAFMSNLSYLVGIDVMPGTYTASGGEACYWWRSKDASFAEASILSAGPFHNGRVVVVLKPGDYFYAEECGSWYFDGFRIEQKMPYFYDGDHTIGVDITPGTYISAGDDACYWWRLSGVGGDYAQAKPGTEGVLGYGPIHGGQTIAEIRPGDPHFVSSGCGRWDPLGTEPSPRDAVSDGDYAVGLHLKPGVWVSTTFTQQCYVEIASGFAGNDDEILWWGKPSPDDTELELPVYPEDVRFTTVGCGTWHWSRHLPEETGAPTGASASVESEREITGLDSVGRPRSDRQFEASDLDR